MPVQHQHPITTLYPRLSILIKVFNPVQAYLVIGPPIRSCLNSPVIWNTALSIPISEVIEALNEQKRGYIKTIATNTGNRGRPFPVARLNSLTFTTSIRTRNNHKWANCAHYKAGLIKVVEIAVKDAVLTMYIRYQAELRV